MNLQSVFTGIWLEYFSISEKLQYRASYISMNYYTKKVTQPCWPLLLFHSSYILSMLKVQHVQAHALGGLVGLDEPPTPPPPPPPPVCLCCPCDWYRNFCKPICMQLWRIGLHNVIIAHIYLKVTIMGRLTQQVGCIE